MQTYIQDISKYEGKEVTIKGWLYNKRSSGKVRFILIRDGTGIVQSVITANQTCPEIFEIADRVTQESSLILTGVVRKDPRAPGGYEIVAKKLQIIQLTKDYPITPKEHSIEFLLPQRHLWLRSRKQFAIMRIRHQLIKACRDFLDDQGFLCIDCPILTPASVEGTTTLFPVDYYGDTVFLTQSGQLYNEATVAALGRVYCFGPTFRAEKSKTRRHLTEFWMLEPEIAYMELEELISLIEDLIVYVIGEVLNKRRAELAILERDIKPLEKIKKPFPRITYQEAVELIKKEDKSFRYGDDFGAPHETIISKNFDRPVFVHHYPVGLKAFYMKQDPVNPEFSLSVDMIGPEGYGELIGGGQREDDYDTLVKRLKEKNLPEEPYRWYLDLRKYGTFPHSGFGLGLERTVAWICGVRHVRETIAFPRMLEKIYP
ncbi:asparagine--tRNA ligase [candidate division WOR-3 bacterium 4484_100]|uniref:Asparagine--tRNA ligase n=1 Tax=candidate division WOR-3 bacterium 4484_100 TaxID=1936077 RepID=A0A1V4QET0_UNCW3|nr:MAG: asparagine--tRNA ligase [candidate division WOR-3 bacterium 4484_100]